MIKKNMIVNMANITDLSILLKLSNSYKVFSSSCTQNIPQIDGAIFNLKETLIQVQTELEHRLNDATRKLSNCNNALTMCKCQVITEYDDNGNERRVKPDCSSEEDDVRNARIEQKAAQKCLDQMRHIMRQAASQINIYEKAKQKFESNVESNVHKAIEELEWRQQLANEYLNITFEE
jgi:hypothetical protein